MYWSVRRALQALYRPREAFDGASAPVVLGATVVALLCILNAAVALHSAGAIAGATTGTVTVDNPDRPQEWICERSDPGEFYDSYQEECASEPKTVQRELATYARETANAVVFYALAAPLAVWVAVSGLLHLLVGGAVSSSPDDRIPFSAVLGVTGVGMAPAALRYLVRDAAVLQSLGSGFDPGSVAAARATAVEAMVPDSTLYAGVLVATVAWSAYVWWGGWRTAFDVADSRAAVVAAVSGFVLALPALSPVFVAPDTAFFGIVLLGLGLPGVAFPRALERIDVAFDLIGTRGGEDIEIRPWRVALAQLSGLFLVVAGAFLVGGLYVA